MNAKGDFAIEWRQTKRRYQQHTPMLFDSGNGLAPLLLKNLSIRVVDKAMGRKCEPLYNANKKGPIQSFMIEFLFFCFDASQTPMFDMEKSENPGHSGYQP